MVAFDGAPTADSEIFSKLDDSVRDEHESRVSQHMVLLHPCRALLVYSAIKLANFLRHIRRITIVVWYLSILVSVNPVIWKISRIRLKECAA